MPIGWIIGILLGVVVIAAAIVSFALGNYFYHLALDSRYKKPIFPSDDPGGIAGNEMPVSTMEEREWFLQCSQPASIRSADGVGLKGFVLEHPDGGRRWVLIAHGYTNCAADFACAAIHFRKQGFSVLAPDLRGHGASGGRCIGMGWLDRKDLIQWIEWILRRHPDAEIVLYGVSMGAAAVMMTTGEELPAAVKCAVEDCGYTSVADQFAGVLRRQYHMPKFPVLYTASLIARMRGGYSFTEASALEAVRRSKTPTLFIHGTADRFVPYAMSQALYEAAGCEKELLTVEGAIHALSHRVDPDRYWQTVFAFADRYLDHAIDH